MNLSVTKKRQVKKKKKKVKCIFSNCALHQNQIDITVFKNIINSIYGKQINLLSTSIKILLICLTEFHVTLTCGLVLVVLRQNYWKYQMNLFHKILFMIFLKT